MTLGTVISSAFSGNCLKKMDISFLPLANDGGGGFNVYCVLAARSIGSFIVAMFHGFPVDGIITLGSMERNTSLVRYEGATKAVSVSYLFLGIGSFHSRRTSSIISDWMQEGKCG